MGTLIEFREVCKYYQMGDTTVKAADHISFQIRKGEFVAIVGQSGSGKSTCMNIIGCLDVPTSGTYLLGAVSEGDDGGRMTVIGSTSFLDGDILPQNPSLANQTLFVNALTAGFDDVSNLSIPTKSLAVTYNTIQNPGLWSTAYIVVLPIGILLCGFLFWLKRRKL